MKFTKKAEYAVILMSQLENQRGEILALSQIAEENQLSHSFLRKVGYLLKDKKLIEGSEGKGGGYKLISEPNVLTLKEILDAVGEPIVEQPCCRESGRKKCRASALCPHNSVLHTMQWLVQESFGKITLNKLSKGELSCIKTLSE